MRLVDLAVLYLAVGGAAAVALYRRTPGGGRAALSSALPAVLLWPLWAPIAWTARPDGGRASRPSSSARVDRVRAALDEGVACVAGTPLERLLGRESAAAILSEVESISRRNEELVTLLGRDDFSREDAERRLESLEREGASARARASARLHLENVRRLHTLAERDARALEELVALVSALRTQLVLVRLSGSSAERVSDIVSELGAHLEGLRQVSEELSDPVPPPLETVARA